MCFIAPFGWIRPCRALIYLHAATTVLGVFLALPLAIYAHARITARIAATRAPYAVRLALTVLAFVFCVTAASLLCFEACRAPCRAWVGVGCLRA